MNRPMAPVAQTPLSPTRLFRWATQAIAGITRPFFLVTGVAVLTNIMAQYNAQLIANFIGQAQLGGNNAGADDGGFSFVDYLLPNNTAWTAVLFAITGLLVIALSFYNRVGTVWLNTQMLGRLQLKLHDKLVQLGPRYHGQHDMGENTSVVMQYTAGAQPMLRDVLAFPFVRGISLATAVTFLFYNITELQGETSVIYALLGVLLLVLPVGGFWLASRLRGAFLLVRERQAALSNTLVDSLTSPQEVQLMNAAPRRSQVFSARLQELAHAQVQAVIQSETANQFQAAVPTILQIGLILWAVFVMGGEAVQAVVGIYLFVPRVVQPIQEMIQFYGGINTAWPNIEKVGMILEEPVEVQDTGRLDAAGVRGSEVVLHDVVFRPQPDRTVIDGVSLRIPEGKITALVGLSGSGKSTVLRLIGRLYDPHSGHVAIGGVDIRELRIPELRSMIGTVAQFPLFISADVRENMRLAAPEATDAEMEAACKQAEIWSSLEQYSPADPLATPVPRTAGTTGLSGGERRRLAIARALLTNPRILLLDEPAAGIDALSVRKIAEELRRAAPGRTIVLVEHVVQLIEATADLVCCLENGRITDVGTPAELKARPSLYRRIAETQTAYGADAQYEVQGSVPVRRAEIRPADFAGAAAPAGGRPRAAQQGAPKGAK